MDVSSYLNAIIHNFNVDRLEMVFDVRNMGELMDPKQTSDYLQSIEKNVTFIPVGIKKEPVQRGRRFLYFVDLTESASDTECLTLNERVFSCPAADPKDVVKIRKRKQKAKSSTETSSAKRRPKKQSQKPKITKKLKQIALMSAQTSQ